MTTHATKGTGIINVPRKITAWHRSFDFVLKYTYKKNIFILRFPFTPAKNILDGEPPSSPQ